MKISPTQLRIFFCALALAAMAVAFYIGVNWVFRKSFTVKRISTCITLEFILNRSLNDDDISNLEAIAQKLDLNRLGENRSRVIFSTPEYMFRSNPKESVYVALNFAPGELDKSGDVRSDLNVCTFDAENGNRWQRVTKSFEEHLGTIATIQGASISLEGKLYGLCKSKERPTIEDTTCVKEISLPVDFSVLNQTVLKLSDRRASR